MTLTETKPQQEAAEPPKSTWEFKRFLPQGFTNEAETPVEALIQAQAILLDEEKWVKSEWYSNEHPEEDPDDPFCNNWQVCAAGAVATVTIGLGRQLTRAQYDFENVTPEGQYPLISCPVPKDQQRWDFRWSESQEEQEERVSLYEEACEFLRLGAAKVRDWSWDSVPAFNDSTRTTRQDVIQAFSQAIAIAAAAEVQADVQQRVKAKLNSVLEAV